jgi:SAM-dependent methyltransferase
MNKLRFLAVITATLFAASLVAQTAQKEQQLGDEIYKPQLGQQGKDVIWLPTPDALVMQMLRTAKTTSADLVYDLGSGDGKIPIAAAKQFGARAVGIEFNPEMAALARRNAERAGVSDRVTIITGDIFKEDFSKATVVTLYLLPDLNLQLRPTILKMKPGTRVVSNTFHMGEWEPDETFKVEERDGHFWIVPADVAGRWTLKEGDGAWDAQIDVTQKFQRLAGTITRGGKTQALLGPAVVGDELRFTFLDTDGTSRTVTAKINGDKLEGKLGSVNYGTPISGMRARPPKP